MMRNRLLSLLLALVLLITLIPAGAMPVQATTAEPTVFHVTTGRQVNPLDDPDASECTPTITVTGTAPLLGSSGDYISESAAVKKLRKAMVERTTVVSFCYTTEEDPGDSIYNIMDKAFAHTGKPKEGDILRCDYDSWYASYYYYYDDGLYYLDITYEFEFKTTAQQEAELDKAVKKLLTKLDLEGNTDYQKVKAIYDYLCENVTYDYDNLYDDSHRLKYTAYAALINKTSVCQGYATLFYRLALELGVDCRIIIGIANGGLHSWNIVELNDKYYNLDATWDAGYNYYDWFLVSNKNFPDHARNEEYATKAFNSAYPMDTANYKYDSLKSNLEIATQPKDVTVASGESAKVTVKALGEGLKYQWYVKAPDSGTFSKSSVTKATYSFDMSASKSGRQVYCVVTDKDGNTLKTRTATLHMDGGPEITTQPKGAAAAEGSTVKTTVKATGKGLKYQWFVKDPGSSSFSKSSVTKATYSCKMSDSRSGRKVYCVITDSSGCSKLSKTVTLSQINITKQPKSATADANETAKTTVKAEGNGVKYQWYVKDATDSKFSKSSVTKATYSCTMTADKSGRQAYCVITDKYGNSVQTQTATLRMTGSPEITSQPKGAAAAEGSTVKTTVKATGKGLKYQWYVKDPGSSKFSKSSVTEASYTCKMSDSKSGRQVYCVITDANGCKEVTKTVTLSQITITQQPKNASVAANKTAKVTIQAEGKELTYQWYIKNPDGTKFSKSSVTGTTYSCKLTEDNSGRQVYCVITDSYGNGVKTKTVTLTVK